MKLRRTRILGVVGWLLIGGVAGAFAQDVMQQRLPFLKVVAEDDRVRVLRYAPAAGDKSAMHSHPQAVVVPATADVLVSLEQRLVAVALKDGQDIPDTELQKALTNAGYTVTTIQRSDTPIDAIRSRVGQPKP
jgi:hypothetical protein